MVRSSSRIILMVCAIVLAIVTTTSAKREQVGPKQSQFVVVQQALQDRYAIKVGSTRSDVEKRFEVSGGFNVRWETRYVYRECEYIGVDVEFEPDYKASETDFSPTDKVKKVSRLYIAYPSKD